MIKISVIVSTYNNVSLLTRCMAGLINQTLSKSKYEIIVVDNNSTDNTKDIIKKAKKKYKIINYFFEKNQGLHNARHRGANEATGNILSFSDDDIIADKNWLA